MPQPYLVPRRFNTSRSTHNSGMSAGTSTVVVLPLTEIVYAIQVLIGQEVVTKGQVTRCHRTDAARVVVGLSRQRRRLRWARPDRLGALSSCFGWCINRRQT